MKATAWRVVEGCHKILHLGVLLEFQVMAAD